MTERNKSDKKSDQPTNGPTVQPTDKAGSSRMHATKNSSKLILARSFHKFKFYILAHPIVR